MSRDEDSCPQGCTLQVAPLKVVTVPLKVPLNILLIPKAQNPRAQLQGSKAEPPDYGKFEGMSRLECGGRV